MVSGEPADHLRDVGAIKRAQRDHAVVRAWPPARPEFRPCGGEYQQRRLLAGFDDSLHQIERGRVGPAQILEDDHGWLRARAGEHPRGDCRQLPAAQFFWREFRRALLGQGDVHERREQGCILPPGLGRSTKECPRGRRGVFCAAGPHRTAQSHRTRNGGTRVDSHRQRPTGRVPM